ncbi:MAG: SelT/SelW/SelH family protein [Planctomycetes bacterium]|nr:SelT/SelW/SelH family protein [Planctomycetota bacterium]
MAAAIQQRFGVEPTLIPGGGGIFEIVADGKLIYSKHQTGRFPTHDEVLSKLT